MTDREQLMIWLHDFYGCDSLYFYEEANALIDKLLANGVRVREWISVEDRLPEKRVNVLVYDRHGNVSIAWMCDSPYFVDGTWRDQTGYMLGKLVVTHWMPLPEAPKEE